MNQILVLVLAHQEALTFHHEIFARRLGGSCQVYVLRSQPTENRSFGTALPSLHSKSICKTMQCHTSQESAVQRASFFLGVCTICLLACDAVRSVSADPPGVGGWVTKECNEMLVPYRFLFNKRNQKEKRESKYDPHDCQNQHSNHSETLTATTGHVSARTRTMPSFWMKRPHG